MVSMRKTYKSQIYIKYVRDKWTNNSISRQPISLVIFLLKIHFNDSLMSLVMF